MEKPKTKAATFNRKDCDFSPVSPCSDPIVQMSKLIHGIYFRVRHFISRLGPWTYGTVKNSKARKHKIFGMVEICVDRNYYFPYHFSSSDWQEIPPFYWHEFKANK